MILLEENPLLVPCLQLDSEMTVIRSHEKIHGEIPRLFGGKQERIGHLPDHPRGRIGVGSQDLERETSGRGVLIVVAQPEAVSPPGHPAELHWLDNHSGRHRFEGPVGPNRGKPAQSEEGKLMDLPSHARILARRLGGHATASGLPWEAWTPPRGASPGNSRGIPSSLDPRPRCRPLGIADCAGRPAVSLPRPRGSPSRAR